MGILPFFTGTFNFALAAAPNTTAKDNELVFGSMSVITRFLYENMPSYEVAGYMVFLLVFLLSALVYKLGFAKKLSFKQNVVIYIFLFLGCVLLTFLALFLPMIEGLIVAALVLILYKVRLWREKREQHNA